ncbi:hypothetical protein ACLB1E_34140 [Escherichia coli]
MEKVALDAHRTVVEKNQQTVMKKYLYESGSSFFSAAVSFATKRANTSIYAELLFGNILPISMDGRPLHNGLFSRILTSPRV